MACWFNFKQASFACFTRNSCTFQLETRLCLTPQYSHTIRLQDIFDLVAPDKALVQTLLSLCADVWTVSPRQAKTRWEYLFNEKRKLYKLCGVWIMFKTSKGDINKYRWRMRFYGCCRASAFTVASGIQ